MTSRNEWVKEVAWLLWKQSLSESKTTTRTERTRGEQKQDEAISLRLSDLRLTMAGKPREQQRTRGGSVCGRGDTRNFTFCLCEVRQERIKGVVVHPQHSTSGPVGSRTGGPVASARWLYPDDPAAEETETDRETIFTVDSWSSGCFLCLLPWPDLSCFTNPQVFHKHLSHTQTFWSSSTPRCLKTLLLLFFLHSLALWWAFFCVCSFSFHICPLQHSISLPFTCQELWRYIVFGKAADRR